MREESLLRLVKGSTCRVVDLSMINFFFRKIEYAYDSLVFVKDENIVTHFNWLHFLFKKISSLLFFSLNCCLLGLQSFRCNMPTRGYMFEICFISMTCFATRTQEMHLLQQLPDSTMHSHRQSSRITILIRALPVASLRNTVRAEQFVA